VRRRDEYEWAIPHLIELVVDERPLKLDGHEAVTVLAGQRQVREVDGEP
jgi:hypothetical protein